MELEPERQGVVKMEVHMRRGWYGIVTSGMGITTTVCRSDTAWSKDLKDSRLLQNTTRRTSRLAPWCNAMSLGPDQYSVGRAS